MLSCDVSENQDCLGFVTEQNRNFLPIAMTGLYGCRSSLSHPSPRCNRFDESPPKAEGTGTTGLPRTIFTTVKMVSGGRGIPRVATNSTQM